MKIKNEREVREFINKCVLETQMSGLYNGESGSYILYIKSADFDEHDDVTVKVNALNTVFGAHDISLDDGLGGDIHLNDERDDFKGRRFAELKVCNYYLSDWADDFTITDCAEIVGVCEDELINRFYGKTDEIGYTLYKNLCELHGEEPKPFVKKERTEIPDDYEIVDYCFDTYPDLMNKKCKKLEKEYIDGYCAELASNIYLDLVDILSEEATKK